MIPNRNGIRTPLPEAPTLIFYDPATHKKLQPPTYCPLCGGPLNEMPYRFNDPRPGMPVTYAWRCRNCEYFFQIKISIDPRSVNEMIRIKAQQPETAPAPQKQPGYRPKPVA
jgi:hypothetical protein